MMDDKSGSLTWVDLVAAVWSGWVWVAVAALVGAGAGWGWWRAAPRAYEAEVRVVPAVLGATAPLEDAVGDPARAGGRAARPMPRFDAATLAEMATSGTVIEAAVTELARDGAVTAEELAAQTRTQVSAAAKPGEFDVLRLVARGASVEEARRRAEAWTAALRAHAEAVARRTAEEVRQRCAERIAASEQALREAYGSVRRAAEESGLAEEEEAVRVLRRSHDECLARLAAAGAARELAEAKAAAAQAPLEEHERAAWQAALAARAEALAVLQRIVEAQLAQAAEPQRSALELRQMQLALEAAVVERLGEELGAPEATAGSSVAASELMALAARWGFAPGDDPHPAWAGEAEQPSGAGGGMMEWLASGRTAKFAEARWRERLTALRQQIAEQEARLADRRWQVEQAQQQYESMQRGAVVLAERLRAVSAAAGAGPVVEVIADASASGRLVSLRGWQAVRTGAVLGLALAMAAIVMRTAAGGARRSPRGAGGRG